MKTPRKHKHAELIKAWLDDDSLEVEWLDSCGDWRNWREVRSPSWDEDTEYRFKPKMITCRNLEFPEPMRVAPEIGSWVYFPNPLGRCVYVDSHWVGDESEVLLFKRGLCHSTPAAAEAHARALIALTEVKP